jgi:hypothetical protein
MVQRTPHPLAVLYERDETAWLERAAELAGAGRLNEIDYSSLAEYLKDMAKSDRREVYSRLVVLLCHLLKWEIQPDQRCPSWLVTILEPQRELGQVLTSGTLHNHATAVWADAYGEARKQAAAETGLTRRAFPEECPWDLESALADPGEG